MPKQRRAPPDRTVRIGQTIVVPADTRVLVRWIDEKRGRVRLGFELAEEPCVREVSTHTESSRDQCEQQ